MTRKIPGVLIVTSCGGVTSPTFADQTLVAKNQGTMTFPNTINAFVVGSTVNPDCEYMDMTFSSSPTTVTAPPWLLSAEVDQSGGITTITVDSAY